MVIKFSCPQGHSLSCPDDQAGKSARCPKCNARLTVPDESEKRADGGDADNAPDATPPTDSASTAEVVTPVGDQKVESAPDTANDVSESNASGTEDEIVFLCPNGHKLNGPARLQGRPGQCPHCGEKFRIPSYDDVDDANDDEYADDEIPMGTIVDDEEIGMEDLEGIEEFHDEYDLDDDKHDANRGQIPVAVEVDDEPVAPPLPARQHPLAQLVDAVAVVVGGAQRVVVGHQPVPRADKVSRPGRDTIRAKWSCHEHRSAHQPPAPQRRHRGAAGLGRSDRNPRRRGAPPFRPAPPRSV